MKKNVASQAVGAQMITAADGTAFTGAVTVAVTGDAGTQATGSVGSGACTHEGNGYHTYAPAQAETNYDMVAFTFTGSGAVPVTVQIYTTFPQTGDTYGQLPTNFSALGIESDGDVTKVNTLDGHTAQTGDTFAALPGNFSDMAITASTGRVTVGTNNDKSGYSISGTKTTLDALNDVSAADVNTQVDTALADIHLDHLLAVDYDPASPPGTATALLNELVEDDAGVSRFTVNALENGPSGSGASAAAIADAVWDESTSGHTSAGTFGEQLKTDVDAILADTNELQTDNVPGLIATAQADLDTLTGSDGVTLATSQPNYAPNTTTPPTTTAIADAVLDEVYEGSTTVRQGLRLFASALFGKLSGAASTTVNIRDEADTKNRISATVDADGNRTAVTLDKT